MVAIIMFENSVLMVLQIELSTVCVKQMKYALYGRRYSYMYVSMRQIIFSRGYLIFLSLIFSRNFGHIETYCQR